MKQDGLGLKFSSFLSGFLAVGVFIYVAQAVFNFLKIPVRPKEEELIVPPPPRDKKSRISTVESERWVEDGGQN